MDRLRFGPSILTIRGVGQPTPGQMQAACTIVAISQNNGFGSGVQDSTSASIHNGIVFQMYTQYRRPSTMNPSSSKVLALGVLAAPGWGVESAYASCNH
jgi:hypothetical protein